MIKGKGKVEDVAIWWPSSPTVIKGKGKVEDEDEHQRSILALALDALQDHSRQTAELFVRARVCAVTQLPKKSHSTFQTFTHDITLTCIFDTKNTFLGTKNTIFGPENTVFRPKNRQKTYT